MRASVIIPCHNAGRWIGETLRSVAAQTLPPHEVIVIDDASTDDSVPVIRATGVAVRLISVNVRNAAAARNAGIDVATGDWIALLDADDVWYPNHLARAAELLAGSNDVAYRALCDDMDMSGATRKVSKPQPITETRSGLDHTAYIRFEDQELYFGHSSVLYRRDRVRDVGVFDPSQVRRHDIDLWLRVINGRTWTWDSAPTVAYRSDTLGSISRQYLSCEFYYLQALGKNRDAYAGPHFESLVRKTAMKVATIAFTNGTAEEWAKAKAVAIPQLSRKQRIAYFFAGLAPRAARHAIRIKRAVFTWRTGNRLPDLNPAGGPAGKSR